MNNSEEPNVYPLNIELPSLKSVFVEMRFGGIILSTGTATLVAKNRSSRCAIITNRHNVTGRHQKTGECLSKTLGTPDNIVVYLHRSNPNIGEWRELKLPLYRENGEPFWIEHPVLGADADLVALNVKWGGDVLCLPYYIETDQDRVGMVVSPAEPVSVIGFPFGLTTSGKLPVWVTGFLAQELSLVSKANPVFLIDCRSRQGQSGSPVIAFRPSGYRSVKDGRISTNLSVKVAWEFLGIYAGRINSDSDLGTVWHVDALTALVDAAQIDYENRNKPKLDNKELAVIASNVQSGGT